MKKLFRLSQIPLKSLIGIPWFYVVWRVTRCWPSIRLKSWVWRHALGIKIGKYAGLSPYVYPDPITPFNLIIGNRTFIGEFTHLICHNINGPIIDGELMKMNFSNKIEIGKSCLIGGDCVLIAPVKICDGAIVGCCSVVIGKKIGKNEIWAGNPARRIGYVNGNGERIITK